jgi:hypothetical protein
MNSSDLVRAIRRAKKDFDANHSSASLCSWLCRLLITRSATAQGGTIVLADRYAYTAFARRRVGLTRGGCAKSVIAPRPDLRHFRVPIEPLERSPGGKPVIMKQMNSRLAIPSSEAVSSRVGFLISMIR